MATFDIIDPSTGEAFERADEMTQADVAEHFAAAKAAQGAWVGTPLQDKKSALAAFRDRLTDEADSLATTLTSEMGKPLGQAKGEILATRARIDFFLEHVADVMKPERVHQEDGLIEVIEHEPLGTIANISAWNYPWFVSMNVVAPALLTGNTVLFKPSEYATLTGKAMVRLLHESGIPTDVVRCVTGRGETGAAVVAQAIDGVFFTGSVPTGRKIAESVAGRFVKTQLELGGKDPAYILPDADIEGVAASVADGAFYNCGQSCCAVERIYVHEDIYDDFAEAFGATVRDFVLGDPRAEGTYIGPMARDPQRDVLDDQIADAESKGGRVIVGGGRIDRPGYWYQPTVVLDASHEMKLMRQESFGPVIGLQKVASDDQAALLMADSEYGLTAAVFGRDSDRARQVLRVVPSGTAYFNCCDRVSPRLPWSGRRSSGLGNTLSVSGIATFTQPRAWHVRDA